MGERQQNLLEVLFDRMPMGIAIFDTDFRLLRWNPTWEGFIEHYTPSSVEQIAAGTSYVDLVPGAEDSVVPLFKQALAGEMVRRDALRLESRGAVSYWDRVIAPLTEDGGVIGVVSVMTDATERVLAFQNLERRVEERTLEIDRRREVAEGLRDILAILNTNRPLDEVLDYIVARAGKVLGTKAVSIYRLELDDDMLRIQTSRGLDEDYVAEMEIPISGGMVGQTVVQGKPMVVGDVEVLVENAMQQMPDPRQQELLRNLFGRYRAILAVPVIVKGEVYGGMALYYPQTREFSDEDVALALSFADQAALAIENARLVDQAEQSAVAAERNRLARDLHDAVTQTLFSASLIAEVLPRLWEQDSDQGRARLEELRQLTRAALAEMRALLLELRPSALIEAKLADVLTQLAEATTGSARVPVTVTIEGEGTVPADAQVALYRIAQEALNNVARHSGATRAGLSLHHRPDEVELTVVDDGRGFDLGTASPESLGLGIMRERAEVIGATLAIESEAGTGTEVTVVWPKAKLKE